LGDVATRSLRTAPVLSGYSWTFSPDGTKLLTPSQLWDANDGQLLGVLQGHKTLVTDAVFSPDGRSIATSSADVRIWDTATQQELLVLARPGVDTAHLMFSADGSTLVAGSTVPGGGLRVWRAPSFEEIEALVKANRHNH
jgi:WD40 repeat protein